MSDLIFISFQQLFKNLMQGFAHAYVLRVVLCGIHSLTHLDLEFLITNIFSKGHCNDVSRENSLKLVRDINVCTFIS